MTHTITFALGFIAFPVVAVVLVTAYGLAEVYYLRLRKREPDCYCKTDDGTYLCEGDGVCTDMAAREACGHSSLSLPPFDERAAAGLTADEIRQRWPRSTEACPDCGATVTSYASFAHYSLGDW